MDTVGKFIFGGISCMVAATVTNPIDVMKVRLQLQGELGTVGKKYKGFTQGIYKVASEEGVLALYKGLLPSLLREGSYSTIRMGLYEPVKDLLHPHSDKPISLGKKILAGAVAGAVGSAIANPTDLIKVRMQAEIGHSEKRYASTMDAFSSIYKSEGLAGLYRGVGPTTKRAMILTASQLPAYDHSKHWLLRTGLFGEGTLLHIVSSMIAGLVCATTTSPIDLVKSRYMNQTFIDGKGVYYQSTWDCFKKTVKSEGIMALYKGWFPNWMRIGPHTIVTFVVFEQLRKLAGIKPV
eukprot:TRINITY_DN4379_c0_g1_i1.p1 TRINITY_DN4379_c0_g1~~TRINITY_DN4379_c0_g1_i1.p1  ORF type:complete len:294 (-),score=40.52 TRINITY_DN4379_c0_g1_i1:22-903(-)